MKTLQQMLRELARPEVGEFAVASDRLPCVKMGDQYQPIDDVARSTDAILDMLVAAGGSRYVEDLETKPAAWTTRVDGLGPVEVTAVMRGGRVQARFTLTNRSQGRQVPQTAAPPAPYSEPAMEANTSDPMLRGALVRPAPPPAPQPPPRVGTSSRLDELLYAARQAEASDLHLVAGRPTLLRIAGDLVPRGAPIDEATVDKMLEAVVPERLRSTLAEQGSCDFALDRPPLGRFRANVSRQRTGLKGCFRCIPPVVPTLASLGLPLEIERATHHHQGLVLVTGPTGHGKTSTLAAIVDIINRESTHHVITVEDPVEYVHPRKRAMIS